MLREDFKGAYLTTYEKGLFPPGRMRGLSQEVRHGHVPAEKKGFCRDGGLPDIPPYGPRFGEERPLVGRHGSGTIFLMCCNPGCILP